MAAALEDDSALGGWQRPRQWRRAGRRM